MSALKGSACFIISIDDSIDDIWQLMSESARLFKFGSGVGADWSTLRSTKEKLSGGGPAQRASQFHARAGCHRGDHQERWQDAPRGHHADA